MNRRWMTIDLLPRLAAWAFVALLAPAALADWKAPREALDRRHVAGIFRIHYTATGPDAFGDDPGAADDLARRLGEQLVRGHRFYSAAMGLTPPPANPRYRDIRAIDVHVIDLGDGKKGSTGDAPIVYRYRHFAEAVPAITISITRRWRPGNLTPEHEVFHAYQYGYTFFKNAWFLEGMANAMEAAFRPRRFRSEPLPQDATALRDLLTHSYSVGAFWHRLAQRCEPACRLAETDAERTAPAVCGTRFVRAFLEELQAADKTAARAYGIDAADWPEDAQRAERNNVWLLGGLARAMEKQCPVGNDAELAGLLNAAKAFR